MTSGDRSTARLPFWRAHPQLTVWICVCVVLALACFVNIATELDDARRRHAALPLWRPVTEEVTSVVAALIASVGVYLAIRYVGPWRRPVWQALLPLALGSVAFSGVHIALMTAFRGLAFPLLGHPYVWAPSDFGYEYRKDVLSYVVMVLLMWALRPRPPPTAEAAAVDAATPPAPAFFDIRDGAALVRSPIADILAAQAAGNYVEFRLADGRRPLMRVSMSKLEAELAPQGFVRTHRSWLVNAERVRGLAPAGSGDFRIDLGAGVRAPLSRRYPAALARLRG